MITLMPRLTPSIVTMIIAFVFIGIALTFLAVVFSQALPVIISNSLSYTNETGYPSTTEAIQLYNQTVLVSVPTPFQNVYNLYLSFISFVGSIFTDPITFIMLFLMSLIIVLFMNYYRNQG